MKKLIASILVLSLFLLLSACAASGVNEAALKKRVESDWLALKGGIKISTFRYLGSDNGYHIVSFTGGAHADAVMTKKIAGYSFTYQHSFLLQAYKEGEFIELKEAYESGLVSLDAIANAAKIYNEKQREYSLQSLRSSFEREMGPLEHFRFYGEFTVSYGEGFYRSDDTFYIVFIQTADAPSVTTVKTIADSTFEFPRDFSLYACGDSVLDLEKAYNEGLVSEEVIANAAKLHAEYENPTE